MDVTEFCRRMRGEVQAQGGYANEAWARGAVGLCDLYGGADAERFGVLLRQTAKGPPGSALAEGARWLLARWQPAG